MSRPVAFADTPWRDLASRLPSAPVVLTAFILGTALTWALVPDLLSGYSATVGLPGNQLKPPSLQHWLGTDELGRDLLARLIHGARYSLSGAVLAVGVGLVAGSAIGLVAGAAGGRTDTWLMRVVDVLLAVPTLLLSLAIIMILGFGHVQAALAVGVTAIASFARLMRSEVLTIWRSAYVEAAFGSGATFPKVLWRHVLPNALTSVLALAALQFGSAILQISTLGFLGYGAPPPTPEWGLLIAEGRSYMMIAWWLTLFPGLAVILVVMAANHLGHTLERTKA
ncbi:ABC transporter permease [Pannonibacter tanglangensis]|uniref:ABC transporter permease subunit n=1 Tax=Pannonibacter tanglangensis TaxID=2750084 RepID=A0ABW9ZP62_9HYPH|nr:ABC transporter permease [Pannonibacter sp. XCT-34]NBN64769.1 ABC transporter permease subunit [Pannonibacter sp. XCT-34]